MIGLSFTMSDLLITFRDAIRNSTEISDFCTDKYSKDLSVAVGADERREWGQNEAPFCVIVPEGMNTGMSQGDLSFDFSFELGILDSSFSDNDGDDIIDMEGVYDIDAMANLVIDLLQTHAGLYNAKADFITVDFDTTFFPLHVANMSVTVQVDHVLGATQTLG